MKRLPEYEKIADRMSLEWPVCDSSWKCDGVVKRLKTMRLAHEGLVALSRVGYVSSQGLPRGKRLKFVSNRPFRKLHGRMLFVLHMLLSISQTCQT